MPQVILRSRLVAGLIVVSLSTIVTVVGAAWAGDAHTRQALSQVAVEGQVKTSSSSSLSGKAATDTFYIYGGPDNVPSFADPNWNGKLKIEGQFQTATGAPDWQGWTGLDKTEVPAHWRASTTNADVFGNPPGNHAVISHHDGLDYQGYGNGWNEFLEFRYDISLQGLDPELDSSSVQWTCSFSHALEPGFDFLHFQFWSGTGWSTLLSIDGVSEDSLGTHVSVEFDSDAHGGIHLGPADYENGEILLRMQIKSDGGASDEDGWFPTGGRGAAAVDDISVSVNGEAVSLATWEPLDGIPADQPEGVVTGHDNGSGPGSAGWIPVTAPGFGDFSKLMVGFQDLDPCRSNISGQLGFVDDGTPPNNAPGMSTGGSVSATWSYGVLGGWVVNYTQGLSQGQVSINNRIVSPEIDLDLPGTEDDAALGVAYRTTFWEHLPFGGGYWILRYWELRNYHPATGWGDWKNRSFGYAGDSRRFRDLWIDVSDIVEPGAEKIQLALGGWDWVSPTYANAIGSTPSPIYDSVMLMKFEVGGPHMVQQVGTIADGFPVTGDLAGPVRFDPLNSEGADVMPITIQALIPGVELADPLTGGVLKVAHLANPIFASERAAGLAEVGAVQVDTDDRGWPIYTYEVPGELDPAEPDQFFFDLPDGPARPDVPGEMDETALIFSGDRLHYYVESQDTAGGVSTLPRDVTGFLDFGALSAYERRGTMHGMPSWDGTGHPSMLMWNQARFNDQETTYIRAMAELGFVEGRDYDLCTRNTHQLPTLQQIEGYDKLLYISPAASFPPGSAELNLFYEWHNQGVDRFHSYMGQELLFQMSGADSTGAAYLGQIMGVDVLGRDVGSEIGEMRAPFVTPDQSVSAAFATDFVAYASECPSPRDMEWIVPVQPGAEPAHLFSEDDGSPIQPHVAASILWDRQEFGFQKTTVTFPFDLSYVRQDIEGGPYDISYRAQLLGEVLALAGMPPQPPVTGSQEPPQRFTALPNHPNPFNPSTSIRYYAPTAGQVSLRIFDARGALVSESQRKVQPGWGEFTWTGRDDRGRPVASGVYYYRVSGFGEQTQGKMALLK